MDQEVWNNYLTGTKTNHQAKIDAEKKAEEERIRKEKETKLQHERVTETGTLSDFIDNWYGTDFGTMDQKVYDGLLADAKKKKTEYDQKQEEIRKENLRLKQEAEKKERKRLADQKIADDKAEKLRKDNEAKLKKVQDDADLVAAELEAKRLADEQVEEKRLAQIETNKQKGDKEKMLDLVADLEKVRHYKFESESYQKKQSELIELIRNWVPVIK